CSSFDLSVGDRPRCLAKDDLTRIKGIGATRQRRLQAMGYCTYRDIINLSQDDLLRIKCQMPRAADSIDGTGNSYVPWKQQAERIFENIAGSRN
ncbi:MAG: hypothetical protein ACR2Q4_22535, partial [Geminicoccaceae bacterium]